MSFFDSAAVAYNDGHAKRMAVIHALENPETNSDARVRWVFNLVFETDHYSGDNNVYFIEAVSTNLIKIGRSINPVRRLAQLQLLSPVSLNILGIMRGDSAVESLLHTGFQDLRSHGEWFHATSGLRRFVAAVSVTNRGSGS